MVSGPQEARTALRQGLRRAMSVGLPRKLFMTSGPARPRSIALTFDDGPDPAHTPAVLDRLGTLGVRGTFFVTGRQAEAHPGLIRRIAAEGHEIGHHSWSHGRPEQTPALALLGEARRTAALLEHSLGRRVRLFRPPHGKLSAGKLLGLWALRQTVVLWNRDPKDFAMDGAAPLRQWFQEAPLAAGDIVLLHDRHAGLAPALEAVVARAAALGLGFTTPTAWLDD